MTLWILLTLLVAVAAVALAIPIVRRYPPAGEGTEAARVYRDQLAEIDEQLAAGAVSPAEAEALRTEAKRRLLAEDRFTEATPRPLAGATLGRIAIGLAAAIAIGAPVLYAQLGAPEHAGTSAAPPTAAVVQPGTPPATGAPNSAAEERTALVEMADRIESRLVTRADDPEGWRLLGWSRYSLGQYPAASEAYAKAVALEPNRADNHSALGETLTLAANGQVTPAAAAAFTRAVALDPQDPRARYFLGLARDQAGDRPGAVDAWIALLNDSPADAPWRAEVQRAVEATAQQAGISLEGRIKAPAPTATVAAPGPSADQIAAAPSMAPEDQQAMIRGMVDRLAERLKAEPQDTQGWLRLMQARMVLGEPDAAAAARREALAALTDPAARAEIEARAKSLGVPGA